MSAYRAIDDPDAIALLDRVIRVCESSDPDSWWEGPTFRSPCGTKHCVLSHVAEQLGMDVMEQFECTWSTSYVIGGAVNDKATDKYPQSHPKGRVLAYLHNLRTGKELSVIESMDAQLAQTFPDGEPS